MRGRTHFLPASVCPVPQQQHTTQCTNLDHNLVGGVRFHALPLCHWVFNANVQHNSITTIPTTTTSLEPNQSSYNSVRFGLVTANTTTAHSTHMGSCAASSTPTNSHIHHPVTTSKYGCTPLCGTELLLSLLLFSVCSALPRQG